MKKIILNNKGQLASGDLAYFGGKFSFMERIRMKGIGSTKTIYKKGVPYFDELAFVENEISFANFELMKNGFLIRVYRNLKLRYIGFQLHEVLKINFYKKDSQKSDAGYQLDIYTLNDEKISFEVSLQQAESIKGFFNKEIFESKFEFFNK